MGAVGVGPVDRSLVGIETFSNNTFSVNIVKMGGQHSVKKEHIYEEIHEKEDGSGSYDRNESVITLDIKTSRGNDVKWELEDSLGKGVWEGLGASSNNGIDTKNKTKEDKRKQLKYGIRFENPSP